MRRAAGVRLLEAQKTVLGLWFVGARQNKDY